MGRRHKNREASPDNAGREEAQEMIEEAVEESAPEQEPVAAEEPKVEFDGWYASRRDAIPAIHKKEIIKADFKGRKVPMVSTMADFDEALKKYGVKLV